MTATTPRTNGVDVARLMDTVDAITANRDLARFQFRGQSRWEGGARTTTMFESFYGAGSEHQHAGTP
jgi:hypothetical protein